MGKPDTDVMCEDGHDVTWLEGAQAIAEDGNLYGRVFRCEVCHRTTGKDFVVALNPADQFIRATLVGPPSSER